MPSYDLRSDLIHFHQYLHYHTEIDYQSCSHQQLAVPKWHDSSDLRQGSKPKNDKNDLKNHR